MIGTPFSHVCACVFACVACAGVAASKEGQYAMALYITVNTTEEVMALRYAALAALIGIC